MGTDIGVCSMTQCKLCQRICKSWGSLSRHIRDNHTDYDSKKYYDTFLQIKPSVCKVCNGTTKFQNINVGYTSTCSHKCGGIFHRRQLTSDETKNANFKSRVSDNQKQIWKSRKQTGTDKEIHRKVGFAISQKNALMTADERKQKFGWLNKLTVEEKQQWVESVLKCTGMYAWWATASEEKIEEVLVRRNATKLSMTVDEYRARFNNLEDKKEYYAKVWFLTEQTYSAYKSIIDPSGLRSQLYHLDHRYSVIRGFHDKVEPEVIASRYNLQIIPSADNVRKSGKCSLDIDTLYGMYNA
jgi:hypothetical protein